jgi:hypothetical protein
LPSLDSGFFRIKSAMASSEECNCFRSLASRTLNVSKLSRNFQQSLRVLKSKNCENYHFLWELGHVYIWISSPLTFWAHSGFAACYVPPLPSGAKQSYPVYGMMYKSWLFGEKRANGANQNQDNKPITTQASTARRQKQTSNAVNLDEPTSADSHSSPCYGVGPRDPETACNPDQHRDAILQQRAMLSSRGGLETNALSDLGSPS